MSYYDPSLVELKARFFLKILRQDNGCWRWVGAIGTGGYGRFGTNRKSWMAHRFSYEIHHGPIPNGYDIHHKCENKWCVNPEHLKAVARREHIVELSPNSLFYKFARKTRCPQGHLYDEINTYLAKSGSRHCRTCMRERRRRGGMNGKCPIE